MLQAWKDIKSIRTGVIVIRLSIVAYSLKIKLSSWLLQPKKWELTWNMKERRSIVSILIYQRTTSLKIMTRTCSLLQTLIREFQMNMLSMGFVSLIRSIYMTLKIKIVLMIGDHSLGSQVISFVRERSKCMINIQ